jgi:hypothetical protein
MDGIDIELFRHFKRQLEVLKFISGHIPSNNDLVAIEMDLIYELLGHVTVLLAQENDNARDDMLDYDLLTRFNEVYNFDTLWEHLSKEMIHPPEVIRLGELVEYFESTKNTIKKIINEYDVKIIPKRNFNIKLRLMTVTFIFIMLYVIWKYIVKKLIKPKKIHIS